MMSKAEFKTFLNTIGGLIYANGDLPTPIELFGIECDDGWLELIAELIRELINAGWTRETLQIKEKFGGLCFYAEGIPENGMEIILRYEQRSYSICEVCGSDQCVKMRNNDWMKTLCDQCAGPWHEKRNRRWLYITGKAPR